MSISSSYRRKNVSELLKRPIILKPNDGSNPQIVSLTPTLTIHAMNPDGTAGTLLGVFAADAVLDEHGMYFDNDL